MKRSFHSKARPAKLNDLSKFTVLIYVFNLLVYLGFWKAKQFKSYAGEQQLKNKEPNKEFEPKRNTNEKLKTEVSITI